MKTESYVHPLSDVLTKNVGTGTKIWQYVIALPDARIGEDCNICSHCFIENDVVIGDRVTVKNGVQIWDGVRLGNDVFIGPNVTFTNDKYPRSRIHQQNPLITEIDDGASIGGGATLLPGIRIGKNAMIGSGAVVTRSVADNAIVAGNPARVVGYEGAHRNAGDTADSPNRGEQRESDVVGVKLHQLPCVHDHRGRLTFGEFERLVPFKCNRYFIVYDVPSREIRGEHAHRECHQFLICVNGDVSVVVDDGTSREEFLLNRSDIGLHLAPMVWATQYKYSSNAVLLVFASDYYDESDYVRDYADFLALAENFQ